MGANQSTPVDSGRLKEFSVVYTGAALNLMSSEFQTCMREISAVIKDCYNAQEFALIPGSGTFAMEAVARQFSMTGKTLLIQNGWFGYRWAQIMEMAQAPKPIVMLARATRPKDPVSVWTPPPIASVVEKIKTEKPNVVYASHVETSTGIILPNEYVKSIGETCREVGALFVLDCIASGAIWVDMKELLVDVLVSAPQKAWSGPACCGFVLFQEEGVKRLQETTSNSFACDLKKWNEVMKKYEGGSFMYHTTLPTDALLKVRDQMLATKNTGFEVTKDAQLELGRRMREILAERGFASVAAPGFEAPGVVVVHSPIKDMVARFANQGIQIAAGMPFKCDEHENTQTFRVGLFGLEKFTDVEGTLSVFKVALNHALQSDSTL